MLFFEYDAIFDIISRRYDNFGIWDNFVVVCYRFVTGKLTQ